MKKYFILFFYIFFTYINADDLKTGDIIFRQEDSLISKLFADIEKAEYAHIGIILHDDKTYVIHSEIAESENGLRVQEIDDFLKYANKWMILRYIENNNANSDKLKNSIQKYIILKPQFNTTLQNNKNEFYCTELVHTIYKEALGVDIAFSKSMFLGNQYISTKDIYSNPNFKLVTKNIIKENI